MKLSPFAFVLLLLVVFGASVFVWQISGADPARAWQAFLINLLYFSAVAQSGPVLAAIYHLTEARWGHRVMALAIGLGSFLPISFVLLAALLIGFPYFPKYSADFPARQAWFNPSFLIARHMLGTAILYSVSLVFSYRFLQVTNRTSDVAKLSEIRDISKGVEAGHESRFVGKDQELKLTPLAVLVLGLYAVVFSLIGFDFVMALDEQWYSTLFGGYFFISSFYIGLAAVTVVVVITKHYTNSKEEIQTNALWDLGKLVFAFCFLTAYLFWAQYLVTWYGNLPEEIGFFVRRLHDPVWEKLAWSAIALTFAIPFLTLLPQRAKQSRTVLLIVAFAALLGMWIERYLLIGPSLTGSAQVSLGWSEYVITLGFVAGMAITYRAYLKFYPLRE